MIKKLLLLSFVIFMVLPAQAQRMSWKKHRRVAEAAFEQGDYAEAAENFRMAWEKKQKKTELIYRAGESFYLLKDYRNAADAYQHVKDQNDSYPLVGLKYARSLKQDGQYDKAIEAFRSFANSYTGESKAILDDIIRTEIQGCQLGKELPARMNRDVEVLYTGNEINSDAGEFAPFPISSEQLYFTSSRGDRARIYSSRREGRAWPAPITPGNFPVIQNNHFGNGAMSPDGQRFYFTICSGDQQWDILNTRCEIFYLRKNATGWSEPQRLPDYVNLKGITATHPSVAHVGGRELIYFASNREGGRGGLDLWYVTRDLGIDNNDFTFPVNVGPSVNTLGDEISPFYDGDNGVLYFSSNGHVSIGGFDVYKSRGEEVNWSIPENVGLPVNSSADDYFYVRTQAGSGFFSSNRVYGGEKTTTRHSDIFEFTVGGRRIMVRGNAYNQADGRQVSNITVSLYQIFDDGAENLLINKAFSDGSYSFELLPDRRFRIEVTSYGYQPASYQFTTDDPNTFTYGQPVYLNKATGGVDEPAYPDTGQGREETGTAPPTAGADGKLPLLEGTTPGVTYTSRGTSPRDYFEYVTSAPRYKGIYYKIQLAAVSNFSSDRFQSVSNIGRVDTEKLVSKELTRVMLGDFFSEDEALRAMRKAQGAGFSSAYVVRYEDGMRYGKVTLR